MKKNIDKCTCAYNHCCFRLFQLFQTCLPGHVAARVDECAAFAVAAQDSACCKCHPSSGACVAPCPCRKEKVPMLQIPAFDLDTKGRPAADALRHEGKFP